MNIIIVTDKETDKIDCMCIDIRTTGIKTVDISYNINEYADDKYLAIINEYENDTDNGKSIFGDDDNND